MSAPYPGDGPLILSHRGGGREAVENSLAALEHMRAHGLTIFETDIRATADGVPVLHHDETLERLCGRPETVRSLTWAELREIPDRSGNPVVSLDEAIHWFPEMRFNIDAKEWAVCKPLAERVRSVPERITVASFSSARLTYLARLVPGVNRSLGLTGAALFRGLAAMSPAATHALFRIARRGVYALQVPEFYGKIHVTTPRFFDAARRLGLQVHVWTVDEPDAAERLIAEGADGIVTDTPAALAAHFEATGPLRK